MNIFRGNIKPAGFIINDRSGYVPVLKKRKFLFLCIVSKVFCNCDIFIIWYKILSKCRRRRTTCWSIFKKNRVFWVEMISWLNWFTTIPKWGKHQSIVIMIWILKIIVFFISLISKLIKNDCLTFCIFISKHFIIDKVKLCGINDLFTIDFQIIVVHQNYRISCVNE